MNTYNIAFGDMSAHVTIEPSLQGARASSILFDDYADILAETSASDMQYIDYCHACIVASELARLYPDIVGTEWEYIELSGMSCHCDD